MTNIRIPRAVCGVIGDVLIASHATLDALFKSSGAPGDPPGLAHHSKWNEWLCRAGNDPEVDSLAVLGNVLEEFMDLPPQENTEEYEVGTANRKRVVKVLEEYLNGITWRWYLPTFKDLESKCNLPVLSRCDDGVIYGRHIENRRRCTGR